MKTRNKALLGTGAVVSAVFGVFPVMLLAAGTVTGVVAVGKGVGQIGSSIHKNYDDRYAKINPDGLISKQWQSINDARQTHFWQWPSTKKGIQAKEKLRAKLLENCKSQVSSNLFGDNNPFTVFEQSLTQKSPLDNTLKEYAKSFEQGIKEINQLISSGKASNHFIMKKIQNLRVKTKQLTDKYTQELLKSQIDASNELFDAVIELIKDPSANLPANIADAAKNRLKTLTESGQLDYVADKSSPKLSSANDEIANVNEQGEPFVEITNELSSKEPSPEKAKQANQIKNAQRLQQATKQRLTNEDKQRNDIINKKMTSLAEGYLNNNREITAAYMINRLSNKAEAKYAQDNISQESSAEGELNSKTVLKPKSNVSLLLETRDANNGITTDGGKINYKDNTYSLNTKGLGRSILRSSLKDQACLIAAEYSSIKWKSKATKHVNGRKVVDHKSVARLGGEQAIATILNSGLDPETSYITPQIGINKDGSPKYGDPIKVSEFKNSATYSNMTNADKSKFNKDFKKACQIRLKLDLKEDALIHKEKDEESITWPTATAIRTILIETPNKETGKIDDVIHKIADTQMITLKVCQQVLATIENGLDPEKSYITPQIGVDDKGNAIMGKPIKVSEFKDSDIYKDMSRSEKKQFNKDYDKAMQARTDASSVTLPVILTSDLFSELKIEHKNNVEQLVQPDPKPDAILTSHNQNIA